MESPSSPSRRGESGKQRADEPPRCCKTSICSLLPAEDDEALATRNQPDREPEAPPRTRRPQLKQRPHDETQIAAHPVRPNRTAAKWPQGATGCPSSATRSPASSTTSSHQFLALAISLACLLPLCQGQFIGGPPDDGTNEVAYVDLRVKENSIQHHTILYEQIDHVNPLNPTGPSMVLRRGEFLNIVIHLRLPYNKQTDKIRLEFSYGARPQVGKGTLIYLPITKDRDSFGRDPSKWDARVVRVDGNQLSVQINLPANIAVGVWRFRVSTKLAGSRTIKTYSVKEALYVIFNAWSKDDAVYLSREDARQEYVLNDVGKIYIGSHAKPRGRKWIYGQFQESVLPAVIFMLDKTRLDVVGRSNVVKVARAVSAMVNSHDDNGLLVGNWSGNYGDGLAPWQWTGSATILEKYLQSGGEPVKFGQCWVFAGVTTTALRTLGIPARTVSNFVSAHDTDDSLTVDKFFSEKGDPISDVNSDSIWNFHVWSDAWMARADLPPGYGGWQAVDATPQETSMGMYQMGPASLEARK
jgi:transglutaminase 1